jgi:hypothetical protein
MEGYLYGALYIEMVKRGGIKTWRALPFLEIWVIGIIRNNITFEENHCPPLKYSSQIWPLLHFFSIDSEEKVPMTQKEVQID